MIGAAGIILLITCLSLIIWKCCCKSERRKEDEVIVEDGKDTIKLLIPQNSIEKSNKHVKNNRKPQHNIKNRPRKVRNVHLPQEKNKEKKFTKYKAYRPLYYKELKHKFKQLSNTDSDSP
ncbi:uncharacterized protein LOC143248344 [Tachypleus tridentatus]|uniref:uncharacterized protein LOC143248344 n=1 Tax=Tachypleus tridentatus TaxID=6853 RepID=UPI003FD36916